MLIFTVQLKIAWVLYSIEHNILYRLKIGVARKKKSFLHNAREILTVCLLYTQFKKYINHHTHVKRKGTYTHDQCNKYYYKTI